MAERVVVCLRVRGGARIDLGLVPRGLVEGLLGRSTALGGRLVAWHASGLSLDFGADALEDAVEFLTGAEPSELEWFRVGMAAGEVEAMVDAGAQVSLARGPALARAAALAQIARAGEVMLDPALERARGGRLLSTGTRLGAVGRERIRGARLDVRHPWRPEPAEQSCRVERPARVGEAPERAVPVRAGALGVVSAERGLGGTRFLEELREAFGASRALAITPHPLGEPLGALRTALTRSMRAGGEARRLDVAQSASLEGLMAGEGLDREASGALIAAWAPGGLVTLDDAMELDTDTLDAVAEAVTRHGVAAVARAPSNGSLPAALEGLPRSGETTLEVLGGLAVGSLVRAMLGGHIDELDAARWARRTGGAPLAVREALLEALEGADLVREGERFVPRVRLAGRGRERLAIHFASRRLRHVAPDDRTVLASVAVLGGDADESLVADMLDRPSLTLRASAERLVSCAWLTRTATGSLTLPSATHRDAIIAALPPDERARLHHAAVAAYEASEAPLSVASACVHALLAGKRERARGLARRAAAAARAAGLGATADALDSFGAGAGPQRVVERGLAGGFAASVSPESGVTLTERAPSSSPASVDASRLGLEVGVDGGSATGAARAVAVALGEGDFVTVERVVDELRRAGGQEHVADRLAAMACLARGETADALRLLRSARELSRRLDPTQRGRAALALAVGLAAAGRSIEALLEALSALACAREAADATGERACARFLAKLSRSAGREESAVLWDPLASG
ncbi:MAG: hypothetical protein OZ921_17360 [Sorangiineae bacterium]|nr:hypothetical protein [Polyangiaceae bacterium]MEB2324286.1 hypothetical protein [Sorangiineae bacterium]